MLTKKSTSLICLTIFLASCSGKHIGIFNKHYEEPRSGKLATLEVENMMSYSKPRVFIYTNSDDCSGKRFLWDNLGVRTGFNKTVKISAEQKTTVGVWYGLGRDGNNTKYCDGKFTFNSEPDAHYLLQLSGYNQGCTYNLYKYDEKNNKVKVEYLKRKSIDAFSNESASCEK